MTDPQACPGPCNNQARKAWAGFEDAYDRYAADMEAWQIPLAWPAEPAPPAATVMYGEPVWSRSCAAMVGLALKECDDLAAKLYAKVDGYRGGAGWGLNGVAAPDHKAIVDDLDRFYGTLVAAEDEWRRVRRYDPRMQRGRGAHARTTCVTWLSGQIADILLVPGSVKFGLDLLYWQRWLRAKAQDDPVSTRSPIMCPRCSERAVRRTDHGPYEYECSGCHRLLTQREYDREYARQADEHDHEQREVAAS